MNNTTLILRDGTVLLLEKDAASVADTTANAETGAENAAENTASGEQTTTTSTTGTTSSTTSKTDKNKNEGEGGGLLSMLPMLLIYGVIILALYFIMIRPQRKKSKEEKKMRENLQVGDEIVTIGGIYGRVISLKEDTMVIESKSDHSKITVARWALQQDLTVHEETEK